MSCSSKIKPYTAEQGVEQLSKQASQVKSMRGRAWVSVNAKEGSSSFPSIVLLDFSKPAFPRMRIEAIDPLGSTHALGVLNDRCFGEKKTKLSAPICLTWVDFDRKKVKHHVRAWNGFPLEELPYLMLGISSVKESDLKNNSVSASRNGEGFDFLRSFFRMHFDLTWIDPGPRLALNAVQGKLVTGEEFFVHYSGYMDTVDFYLPKQVELKAPALSFDATLKWRERAWDNALDDGVFEIPARMFEMLAQ